MRIVSKKSSIIISLFFLIFAILFSACSNNNNEGKLILTDLSNRTISLNEPATKIAALSASDCEVLCAIGAEETIIARGSFCDYPERVKSIKDVGSGDLTNTEELVAMRPDVVLMSKTGFTLDQVNAMEAAGLKTLVNEANTFEDTYKYIQLLSELTGQNSQGENLISSMKKSVEEFRSKTVDKEKKTVYFQLCLPEHGY